MLLQKTGVVPQLLVAETQILPVTKVLPKFTLILLVVEFPVVPLGKVQL